MKRKVLAAVAVLLAFSCLTAIIVSAAGSESEPAAMEEVQRVPVVGEKVYYAYYNTGSGKGAVALCLNNSFVSYGEGTGNIKVCTKDANGNYEIIHEIQKESVGTWFYGKSEYTVDTCDEVKSLLGGLSGLGISVQSDKVNLAFELSNQPIDKNTAYYIYIPQDYFVDEAGLGNAGAYIEIPGDKINGYTGDLLTDLKNATSGLYDIALFGLESIGGLLSR